MTITESVSIIAIVALVLVIAAQAFFYYKKYIRLIRSVTDLVLEKQLLLDKIDTLNLETSKDVNEGFIKFLSESRESAFEYIEDVQSAIQSYLVATLNNNPDEIIAARLELFSYLPEQSDGKV